MLLQKLADVMLAQHHLFELLMVSAFCIQSNKECLACLAAAFPCLVVCCWYVLVRRARKLKCVRGSDYSLCTMLCLQAQAAATGNLLPAKGKGKQKQAAGRASSKAVKAAAASQHMDDDQEDLLQDYELSDESEMEN